MQTVEFRLNGGLIQFRCLILEQDEISWGTNSDGEDITPTDIAVVKGWSEWQNVPIPVNI